jgi:hypothetical protein
MPATIPADSDFNTFAHGLVRRFAERASGRRARLRAGDASIPARRVKRDQALMLADRAEAGVAGAAP